jgi:Ras-related protein Rab-7A
LQAAPQDPSSFPFVLIGNKVDRELEERKVAKQKAMDWCKMNGNIPYYETSSKENINVKEIFEQMATMSIRSSKVPDMPPKSTPVFDQRLSVKSKEGGCKC